MSKTPKIDPFRTQLYDAVRRALGADRNDVGLVKDRLILQADIIFEPFTDDLSRSGRSVMQTLGNAMNRIGREIPQSIPWSLQIDVHSCASDVLNARFPDKESQTQAQTMALREFFLSQGFPVSAILLNAYGDSQLLDRTRTERAARKNRRIEIRLANPDQPFEKDDVEDVEDGANQLQHSSQKTVGDDWQSALPASTESSRERGPRMITAEEAARQDESRKKRGGTLLGNRNREQSW